MNGSLDRVLVTGARGFTGRYLGHALRLEGCEVVGLNSPTSDTKPSREGGYVEHLEADLLDLDRLTEIVSYVSPSVVVHLAAISFAGGFDYNKIYQTNLTGTVNLQRALIDGAPDFRKLVFASSGAVYGPGFGDAINESVPVAPGNHYAVSKIAGELALALEQNQRVVVSRPFNYSGVGQSIDFVVPKLVDAFCRGEKSIQMGNLDVARDFSDVRDVVTAYAHLVSDDAYDGTINICSGRSIRLTQIVEWLKELTGNDLRIDTNPAFVRESDPEVIVGSNEKLLSRSPISFRSFRETLEWMVEAHAD